MAAAAIQTSRNGAESRARNKQAARFHYEEHGSTINQNKKTSKERGLGCIPEEAKPREPSQAV
jgi:hypothetical protein